jgi:hypothetical protein
MPLLTVTVRFYIYAAFVMRIYLTDGNAGTKVRRFSGINEESILFQSSLLLTGKSDSGQ